MTVKGFETTMRKRKKRRIVHVLVLILLVAVGFIGWNYLKPLVVESSETIYDSYTVETGDITNTMSFSASVALLYSETHAATAETTVRKVYVEQSQKVNEGDKLLQLASGEMIKAGIDGTVNEIAVEEGDKVYPNTSLTQICDLENMQVSLRVDEYDIDKVSVGQKCTVTIMSLGLSFETEIAHINRISAASGNVAYYSVTAEVKVPENVLPGMQATVTILSAEANDVPVLDMNALTFKDKEPYVLVKSADGAYEEVSLEVGMNDGLMVEIKSGLSVGDEVYTIAGTESVESLFTVQDIYNALVGETVVINDMSGAGMGRFGSGEMPFGDMTFDPENMPEGFDLIDMTIPEGAAPFGDGDEGTESGISGGNESEAQSAMTEDTTPQDEAETGETAQFGEANGTKAEMNGENMEETGTTFPSDRSEIGNMPAMDGEMEAPVGRGERPSMGSSAGDNTPEDGGNANG